MAAHSSVLAWRISGTGEPGVLPSLGSHSVGHDCSDSAAAAAAAAAAAVYIYQCRPLNLPHSLLPPVCLIFVCVSFAALQMGSSVPSFQLPYICVDI